VSEFIVLGLIPGTQMQITFIVWLVILIGASSYIMLRSGYRARLFHAWVIATSISIETQRRQF